MSLSIECGCGCGCGWIWHHRKVYSSRAGTWDGLFYKADPRNRGATVIGAYDDGFSMVFIYYYGYHSQPNDFSRKQTLSTHPIAE